MKDLFSGGRLKAERDRYRDRARRLRAMVMRCRMFISGDERSMGTSKDQILAEIDGVLEKRDD